MARRRRRVSGRSRLATFAAVALVLVLAGLLINGVVSGANSSNAYLSLVNRSFAAQTNSITQAQTVQGQQLSTLLKEMPTLDRQSVALKLADLVRDTQQASEGQQRAGDGGPSGTAGSSMNAIVSARAAAVAQMATSIDGLLGLEQPTSPGLSGQPSSGAALLPSSVVVARLSAAGAQIAKADRAVLGTRVALARAPGNAHLIRNVFVADSSLLSPTSMASLVSSLSSSPSLAIVHQVQLVTTSLSPSPLPNAGAFQLVQLPPTHQIVVSVTLRNLGNVFEPHVSVTAVLTAPNGQVLRTSRAMGSIVAAGALNLVLPRMLVSPGALVQLTVTVAPPAGQADTSALGFQAGLAIAASSGGA